MKRIIINLAILGAICFTSCKDDFLVLLPETSITSASFYKTATHFEQAIVASYERVRPIALNGMIMDEMRADNCHFTRYMGDRGPYLNTEVVALFLDDETQDSNGWNRDRYNGVYQGIARVNTILDRLEAAQLTDAEKASFTAEAKFLRAFFYLDMVTHWGPVPLMLNEVTVPDDAFIGNSTIEEVYAQIIEDATDAINLGIPTATTFPQSGRATMGAAKMVRAYAYMSKPSRDYPAAERDLKDITNMSYGLEDDFANIFSLSNKNGKEIIFAAQYRDGPGGQHNDMPWRYIPKCSNNDVLMGFLANNIPQSVNGGWCTPTQEFIDSFEPGDKRLPATVAVAQGTGDQVIVVNPTEPLVDIVGFVRQPGVDYHYFNKKQYHPPYGYDKQASDNFQFYRYADALLLLAECLVEQNKAGEAQTYLDQVRARAGLAPVAATKQSVSDERRHELAFEHRRWTDLIRTGQAVDVMNAHGRYIKSIDPVVLDIAYNVTQDRLLYPFPIRELRINRNLVQNPGYKGYY